MDITIWSAPFSISVLMVAVFLWERAKTAERILRKTELYILSVGVSPLSSSDGFAGSAGEALGPHVTASGCGHGGEAERAAVLMSDFDLERTSVSRLVSVISAR